MWNLAILQVVLGFRVAAPREGEQLRQQLREAVEADDAPTVVRYSKGALEAPLPTMGRIGGMDVLHVSSIDDDGTGSGPLADVLIVSEGAPAPLCLDLAEERLSEQGMATTSSIRAGSNPLTTHCPAWPPGTAW